MNNTTTTPDFQVYSYGPIYASVCTRLSLQEAIRRLNKEYPTGIESQWRKSKDKKFKTGQLNPCPCEKNPSTHKHYLFNC